MLNYVTITEKEFVNLTGKLGTKCVDRNAYGTRWRIPDGRMLGCIYGITPDDPHTYCIVEGV